MIPGNRRYRESRGDKMAKKAKAYIKQETSAIYGADRVFLISGRRRALLPNAKGSNFGFSESEARENAAWWAERLGLEIRGRAPR